MVFQRIWNFAKRHRKKVIASAVITGGAYCAWRILLPKLQDALLQSLLGGSEGLNELLELAARGEEGERKGGSKLDFEHKQQVSDAHVRRKLSVLRARHNACFAVEECTKRLQEAKASNTGKAEAFLDFQVECLAKAASAVYTLHVVLLFHRVEFNIAGRELSAKSTSDAQDADAGSAEGAASAGPEEDAGVYAAFLDSMGHAGEEGVKRIADAVRRAVRSCMEGAEVQPQSATTAESLEQLLLDACREADKELLAESAGATLLPESLDQALLERHGLAAEPSKEASRLLDEARDYLESPQFTAVFQAAVRGAVKRLAGSLEQLADGSSCPLAKLNGNLVALSNSVLDEEGGEDHIAGFADEASVGEFCEMLFFPEQDAATSPR